MSEWYRNQAAKYGERLNEWLDTHPGKNTKARQSLVDASLMLTQKFNGEEAAWHTINLMEEQVYEAPASVRRVLAWAIMRKQYDKGV
ncbi:MAG: hypothetical protein P8M65_13240 [Roseibacillus sp.]|nr:hypothetical protein [Roseibacillus sp.]